jgi:hypothetical protein
MLFKYAFSGAYVKLYKLAKFFRKSPAWLVHYFNEVFVYSLLFAPHRIAD